MGVQSDVPRDCRTIMLYASGCGYEFFLRVCFLLLEESTSLGVITTGVNC